MSQEYFEVVVDQGENKFPRYRRLESAPFTGDHTFDDEDWAIQRGRENDIGFGFYVEKVVVERTVVHRQS